MSKFQMLVGGGDTQVITNRVGHRNQMVTTTQAQKIVHVRNLPFSFSELDFIRLCGELRIEIARVQYPVHGHGPLEGQPKGFAFLECLSPEMAQSAIQKLNKKVLLDSYTLIADIFAPSAQDDAKLHGFTHLKRRNKETNDGTSKTQSTTTQTIDGVPYNVFLKLSAELDGINDDDLSPIFDLPAMKIDKRTEEVHVDWGSVAGHNDVKTQHNAAHGR